MVSTNDLRSLEAPALSPCSVLNTVFAVGVHQVRPERGDVGRGCALPVEPQPATPRHDAAGATPRQVFGRELRRWREKRSVSQAELAELVYVDKSKISRIESGQRPADAKLVDAIDRELQAGGALRRLLPAPRAVRARPASLAELGLPPAPQLVGRRDEFERVLRALTTGRGGTAKATVAVVHGMPGVGKTALALAAAHELAGTFPDGRVYRDLGGDTEGMTAVPAAETLDWLLRHLGVDGKAIPDTVDERAALFRGRMRGLRALFVFDNVHEADQVLPLIPAEPGCAVLVATRRRLTSPADAEQVELGPLASDAAAHLLLSLVSPGEPPGPAREAEISEIAERCFFLPLALHVASGMYHRKPHLGLRAVRDRLERTASGVTEVFGAALNQLREPEARLFLLLSLHPGRNITAAVAAALTEAAYDEGSELLEALWDAHLLLPGRGDGYALHDLLRRTADEEAVRRLSVPDRNRALTRLAALHLALADAADRLVSPQRNRMPLPEGVGAHRTDDAFASVAQAWAWLEDEEATLVALSRAALDAGAEEYCWQLAHALRGYFFHTGRCEPWIAVHKNAVAAAVQAGDLWWEATSKNNLGLAYAVRRDVERASEQYEKAFSAFTLLGDEVSISHTLGHQAWIDHLRGDFASAVEKGVRALEVYRREGLERNAAIMLREIGGALASMGQDEAAACNLGEAIAEFDRLGLDLDLCMSLNGLAELRLGTGDTAGAVRSFEAAERTAAESGSVTEQARALRGLGDVALSGQQRQEARELWRRALSLVEDLDLPDAAALRTRLGPEGADGATRH